MSDYRPRSSVGKQRHNFIDCARKMMMIKSKDSDEFTLGHHLFNDHNNLSYTSDFKV